MKLEGKIALVTGTSPNIMGGIAEGLAEEGADLVCIDINPDYAEAYRSMGKVMAQLGRHKEAIEAYRFADAANPDDADAEAYFNMGLSLLKLSGGFAAAIDAYKKAIEIKPDYANAYYNMGVALGGLGRHMEAIAAYKSAIAIDPDYADAYSNMGNALDELGRYMEAIDAFKSAVAIKPTADERASERGHEGSETEDAGDGGARPAELV